MTLTFTQMGDRTYIARPKTRRILQRQKVAKRERRTPHKVPKGGV